MRFQEPWELSHDIHDIGCHDSFVIFAFLLFTKVEQLFDHRNNKSVFILLNHAALDGTKGPTEFV